MFGGDVATYRMLLDMLRDQILPDLVVLFEPLKRLATEDCSEAEVDAVRKKLHALKSPVSGVCAMVLGSLLTQLHDALRNRETILLEDVVRLEQVYQSTLEDIAVWLEKTSS
jgi:hypothetical protein